MASPMTIDFTRTADYRQHPIGIFHDSLPKRKVPISAEGHMLSPKQIRARVRRKMKRHEVMTDQELDYLYQKPIDQWDMDELAHGRPRNEKGHFKGPSPKWITAAVHEESMTRYTAAVKSQMRGTTVDALTVLKSLINDDAVDDRGKPLVPASTKLDAAKFLIEHVVGKPTQRIESDVSVKLQGILGQVMVNPAELAGGEQGYMPGHFPGVTMALGQASNNEDEDVYYLDDDADLDPRQPG